MHIRQYYFTIEYSDNMPFIQSPAKVLLTGANGYYAVYVIKELLERGYTVVGTVRSAPKGEELVKLFPSHNGKFSYAVVPNILKAGAFDQVLKEGNFDAVAHAASPVVVPGGTVQDYVRPAIDGTVGILESIKAHGSTVKRVVITSSIVTTFTFQKDTHWNEYIIKLVEEKGDSLPSMMLYTYSKTLAEKAVWKWWSENEKTVKWDLATINPSFMVGAPIHSVTSRDQLTSTNEVLSAILAPHQDVSERPWALTHVQDVAVIHSALFENKDSVSGRRVLVVGSQPSWQDTYDALSGFTGVPKGTPGVGNTTDVGSPNWDTTFARELLGREFTGTKEMLVETEEYYRQKGWSFFA
ncbi:NADPH-dependent methylglyoxal reductase GRE2 [Rhizoctonia solani AG-3 Rhs1AP]|uniref:NADPH-dependent methylglyoxal reductase GRE2 n=1 Tax=Rhizoctonia solani AG-3 Rhs1AP TaxID=1086054 RepID=X8IYX4_9AGAM|nr:NADPH-dependent methylglyoxal reductase GRE2 [Rhizoctonia solani AG-3 Rhs1AP]